MLVKCESKSCRVKGITFHPNLSWVLVSLHNGVIQLWDYRLGCLIQRFEEHTGPVRGLDFHNAQALFASGGDDHLIKIWDYKHTNSLFALSGHIDYIRTVQFHHTYPWLCSSSDDQTIRVWNWQSRHCLAILTGHHHYVMCATFHPGDEDLLASASLDQTVRVWDLTGLREKTVSSQFGAASSSGLPPVPSSRMGATSGSNEIFGATDAVCKYILDGHDRGVNWVAFHHKSRMLASASDDRLIKLWRYDDHKWWEFDTLRGHFNNVSCVAFHPLQDALVSNSEDRTIRVWSLAKRTLIHSYRRDSDRFWALACQANSQLIGVGHDSGMVVFKLDRERPASLIFPIHSHGRPEKISDFSAVIVHENSIYFNADAGSMAAPLDADLMKGSGSNPVDMISKLEQHVASIRRAIELPFPKFKTNIHSIFRNHFDSLSLTLAVLTKAENATDVFDYVVKSVQISRLSSASPHNEANLETGRCLGLTFCSRNKFVTLDEQRRLNLHTIGAPSALKPIALMSSLKPDALFSGGETNRVMIRTEDSVVLFDISSETILGELNLTIAGANGAKGKIRRAVWSYNKQYVALLSKHYVCLASGAASENDDNSDTPENSDFESQENHQINQNEQKKSKRVLQHLMSLHECIRLKSGCWDEHDCFVYNTASHLKYVMINGDSGIFMSLPESYQGVYAQQLINNNFFFYNKNNQLRQLSIDVHEQLLKVALNKRKFDTVAMLLKKKRLPGLAWIGYLKKKGFSEIAYHCVRDPASRAVLATEFGDLEAATEAVTELDTKAAWKRLGQVALRLGDPRTAETAFQKSGEYALLVHLYTITGNFAKLKKLGDALYTAGDLPTAFHISLLTGDIESRIKLLLSAKRYALAYALAKRHELKELEVTTEEFLEPAVLAKINEELTSRPGPQRLSFPPLPISIERSNEKWPVRVVPETQGAALAQSGAFKELFDTVTAVDRVQEYSRSAGQAQTRALGEAGEDALETKGWGNEDDDDDDWGLPATKGVHPAFNATDAVPTSDQLLTERDAVPGGDPRLGCYIVEGPGVVARSIRGGQTVCDLLLAGEISEAYRMVNKNVMIGNKDAIIPLMLAVYQGSRTYVSTMMLFPPVEVPLLERTQEPQSTLSPRKQSDGGSPVSTSEPCGMMSDSPKLHNICTVGLLDELFRKGIHQFGQREFDTAISHFRDYLAAVCLIQVNLSEQAKVIERIQHVRDYILVSQMELRRSVEPPGSSEDLSLRVLASSCEVPLAHKFLLLREAVKANFKAQNYIAAAYSARIILSQDYASKLKGQEHEADRMKKVIVQCEQKATDAVDLKFDLNALKDAKIDANGLALVPSGEATLECTLCRATLLAEMQMQLCPCCSIAMVGAKTMGVIPSCSHD